MATVSERLRRFVNNVAHCSGLLATAALINGDVKLLGDGGFFGAVGDGQLKHVVAGGEGAEGELAGVGNVCRIGCFLG